MCVCDKQRISRTSAAACIVTVSIQSELRQGKLVRVTPENDG